MNRLLLILLVPVLLSCDGESLPIYGERTPKRITVNGIERVDTLYHTVPEFQFVDQNNKLINSDHTAGKIYVANFFFTRCPVICPEMMKLTNKVDSAHGSKADFLMISHTVDPENDSVPRLKQYEGMFNFNTSGNWHMVTGDKAVLYDIAFRGYLSSAGPDAAAPGGFLHTENVFLVDRRGRIRGIYGGREPWEMDKLIADIDILYKETE